MRRVSVLFCAGLVMSLVFAPVVMAQDTLPANSSSTAAPVEESPAIAAGTPPPPAYEVRQGGDVVIEGDVILAGGCSQPGLLGAELSPDELEGALAQCREFGFATEPGTAPSPTPSDADMRALPETGGPALLLTAAGLSLAGLGALGLGARRKG